MKKIARLMIVLSVISFIALIIYVVYVIASGKIKITDDAPPFLNWWLYSTIGTFIIAAWVAHGSFKLFTYIKDYINGKQ